MADGFMAGVSKGPQITELPQSRNNTRARSLKGCGNKDEFE